MNCQHLAPLSKAPKNKRRGQTPKEIEEFIIRYRKEHPRVGQLTIKPALDEYCKRVGVKTISISTIGRLIKKLKKQGLIKDNPAKLSFYARSGNFKERIKRRYKKLRRKGYKPDKPEDLVQIDSITIFEDGLKRYILTGIDLKTRFAFEYSYTTLSSLSARDFMEKFRKVAPFEIKRIQTDNGCEFEKYFRRYVEDNGIIHFHNYPRHPQSNACVERFNRTINEQYVDWHLHELHDLDEFNKGLMNYLIWYNTERPYESFNRLPSLKYFLDTNGFDPYESKMLWDCT